MNTREQIAALEAQLKAEQAAERAASVAAWKALVKTFDWRVNITDGWLYNIECRPDAATIAAMRELEARVGPNLSPSFGATNDWHGMTFVIAEGNRLYSIGGGSVIIREDDSKGWHRHTVLTDAECDSIRAGSVPERIRSPW